MSTDRRAQSEPLRALITIHKTGQQPDAPPYPQGTDAPLASIAGGQIPLSGSETPNILCCESGGQLVVVSQDIGGPLTMGIMARKLRRENDENSLKMRRRNSVAPYTNRGLRADINVQERLDELGVGPSMRRERAGAEGAGSGQRQGQKQLIRQVLTHRLAIEQGMRTLLQDGVLKILDGQTDLAQLSRVAVDYG